MEIMANILRFRNELQYDIIEAERNPCLWDDLDCLEGSPPNLPFRDHWLLFTSILKKRNKKIVYCILNQGKFRRFPKVFRQLRGLKFSMAQKKVQKMPVGGSASLEKCQLGDFNLWDFLGTISIPIHFFLINITNEHYSLSNFFFFNK